jgi:hydroxyethylthiazole kinase-like uncharacterized protein yjeF
MSEFPPLYDRQALRRIEAWAVAHLGGDDTLMRRAGLAAWRTVLAHWPQAQRIAVVCGPGNNGGDGWVLARHAREAGRDVVVLQTAANAPRGALAQRMQREYVAAGGRIDDATSLPGPADLIVDALFGIGLTRAPGDGDAAAIAAINAAGAPVLALDVPSGVDADRGDAPGAAVRATRTLQFIAGHPGLATGAALEYAGARDVAALDVPADAFAAIAPAAERIAAQHLAYWLRPRRRNTHKGESGRVLCIGGDHGKGGAIVLCADAALRAGAGLVNVATRAEHVGALLSRRPEAMTQAVDGAEALSPLLDAADAVALGPGLGRAAWGRALHAAALACGKPLVIDADALNLLADDARALPAGTILTPHPGEAARLLGIANADVQADRFGAARALCERHRCVVVLKGAGTLVAAPGAVTRVIDAGNPGMAVGGMGDLLTGIVAALRAQGHDAFEAATCGALLHAVAGDAAARDGGERGLLPSDLLAHVRTYANP